MDSATRHQQQLLERTRYLYHETPISEATEAAYLATPRHLFVTRYREWGIKEWHEVSEANLEAHLATLYADRPLILSGDDDDDLASTISQPSFVLRMLDLLQLRPGQTVFELGTGSGWNAALMAHLVGPTGWIYSLEIIPEVAQRATDTLKRLGVENVRVISADGGDGHAAGAPYDRGIFSAGTYDLPRAFYEQMKESGLLLVVIKTAGGGDTLFLLRKRAGHFESVESMLCGFVQLRGKHMIDALEPLVLEMLAEWPALQQREIGRTPFWWGGKGEGNFGRTLSIRSFLGITEPCFRAFKTKKTDASSQEKHYFGLWDQEHRSLVLAKDDWLIVYGTAVAKDRLIHRVKQWVDLGMPSAASFALRVYPMDARVTAAENQWLIKRRESQFLWCLD